MSKEDTDKEEVEEKNKKVDIKSLVNIIPPASSLRKEKTEVKEKRVKIRKKTEVDAGTVIISSKLANEINAKDEIEISVKGRRNKFKIIVQDNVPATEIWSNSEDMLKLGLEDNSTVSVRSSK
ncbi:hypothetical protein [Sulfolobus acidocaldarius]|uniref:Conserved Crenarchaeal protein n=4 Tax=Sulfolobus acidocaldarius TaxID=2285 RepID=Q4JAF1_SULAC|nr:hypothetical protein [Sulfolobus acidocaldarius]AAY80228.1 conserved Crenarchaeal protein [Sulfolobus acidocaldarius DSM 639]AGE70807.1 hypothetical protein SacN8_04180 [Sulfolobus acidocaldarius N8]AGE73078.1 hypothetical protein SacRon12I_04170 [Sulfolobus acidocaldarius Ron12/I]ALU28875.1 hypothetical protein ATY89_02115 [Sulfolobus acidocaldarius]ALU31597.1 hypothetical protein ATZ20_05150 [Sulfolobus acidocaldarius]